ncbi:MAG: sigma-54-dependent Fis family transcriptional regulator [bacterium]|nr:MAG: sigma-54-dependent Fis family transcriptional regulator [bacterium]
MTTGAKGRIFIVDDDRLIVSLLTRTLQREGFEVMSAPDADQLEEKIASFPPDILLLDIGLPGRSGLDVLAALQERGMEAPQAVILTADDTADTAIRAMKLGAVDYLVKPFEMDKLRIVINNIIEKEDLRRKVDYLSRLSSAVFTKKMIGESAAMRDLREKAEKLAGARVSTVLISGESGTGKELLARHIHQLIYGGSEEEYAPFMAINCAAIPDNLIESELFGHVKGAFTDAKSDKKGVFELANNGSLLLDEIGEMRPDLQSKLLRVLEERTVRRIGGRKAVPVHVTVMATTNIDLDRSVHEGFFRKDLYYRLSTFPFHIPPLRQRKEDIMPIASYFVEYFCDKFQKKAIRGFSPEAEGMMLAYSWPGNVREVRNAMERIAVLESAEIITPDQLPREVALQKRPVDSTDQPVVILPADGIPLEAVEESLIRQALQKTDNNRAGAARLLSIGYDALRYRIRKLGIE